MKRIPLRARDGSVRAYALVDDADFLWLSQWSWCLSEGYVTRHERSAEYQGRKRRSIKMHRSIMGLGHGNPQQVDHKNRNKLDNQRSNLRLAPRGTADNKQNLGICSTNTSGYRGVHAYPRLGKWVGRVQVAGKKHFLGYYDTPGEADVVVKAFRAKHMPFSTN